jgi:DNA gyrase subunit A
VVDLMTVMPGPDFPDRRLHPRLDGIREAYETGRGSSRSGRGGDREKRETERQSIVVTEIPYMTNKARLIEKIAELVREKKIEGISDLRDESDREGMRIVVELKKGEVGEIVLNNLYKHTQMQTTFGIIFLAIVDNQPRGPGPESAAALHRASEGDRRPRTRFDLRKAEERAHILEGLTKALDTSTRSSR